MLWDLNLQHQFHGCTVPRSLCTKTGFISHLKIHSWPPFGFLHTNESWSWFFFDEGFNSNDFLGYFAKMKSQRNITISTAYGVYWNGTHPKILGLYVQKKSKLNKINKLTREIRILVGLIAYEHLLGHLIPNWAIGLISRVFTNDPGDQGSIPGQVIPKTQKNGTWSHLA